ncbi:hypothetical protein SODG_000696 [Sodalis praecaptivus]
MQTINFWQLVSFGEHGWDAMLLSGMAVTIALSLCGFVLSTVIGALVAWAKIAGNAPLRIAGDIYTTVLRGIPDLLVIYLFYFGGSSLLSALGGLFHADGFIAFPGFLAGMLAVGITAGAQQTEVFRGAYRAISPANWRRRWPAVWCARPGCVALSRRLRCASRYRPWATFGNWC